ncbi:MAG: hypothetical protein CXT69_04405 [Methanobacteriota archaeon]|nr:MAG: hypothetical protein CXT69_04405 [Euryarchaeota archaeon]
MEHLNVGLLMKNYSSSLIQVGWKWIIQSVVELNWHRKFILIFDEQANYCRYAQRYPLFPRG